jgi:non-heme chloroperoxidase
MTAAAMGGRASPGTATKRTLTPTTSRRAKVSQGLRDSFWLQGMQAGFKGVIDCIKAFSETDFTEDLKKFDVPTLILHGDDDQIVPIGASALLLSKIVKGATLKIYPGAPHGLCSTHKDQVNADLLAFFKEQRLSVGA